jgi:hypothetical protein
MGAKTALRRLRKKAEDAILRERFERGLDVNPKHYVHPQQLSHKHPLAVIIRIANDDWIKGLRDSSTEDYSCFVARRIMFYEAKND